MNFYEHTIIARQDISPAQLKQVEDKYKKIINNNEGNLLNVEIDEGKAKQFIKKHESSFDMLGDEYMKKIHSIEK